MSKHINVNNVLYYYDGVQVFDATDVIGGNYIGLFVEDISNGERRYLVVGTSPESLHRFCAGDDGPPVTHRKPRGRRLVHCRSC